MPKILKYKTENGISITPCPFLTQDDPIIVIGSWICTECEHYIQHGNAVDGEGWVKCNYEEQTIWCKIAIATRR
jgi:hypothetical protein